jgi:hypothetical protein
VVSDDSQVTFNGRVTQSSKDIIEAGYPIFIGSIPWAVNGGALKAADQALGDLNMIAGSQAASIGGQLLTDAKFGQQILTIADPAQIPLAWGQWFGQAFDAAVKTGIHPSSGDLPPIMYPYFDPTRGFAGHVPAGCCTGQQPTCDVPPTWGGQPNTQGYKECNCPTDPGCYKAMQSTPTQPVTWVGAGPDANKFPAQWVKYAAPNDQYTYKWLTPADWVDAFRPGLSTSPGITTFFWNSGGVYKSDTELAHQFFEYDPALNVPPTAKFRNPLTGETWGVWFAAIIDSNSYAMGAWNVQTDNPNGYKLKIGIGPIPQEPWYDVILDALEWIPMTLGAIVSDALAAILSLVCSNPQQAAAQAKSNPYATAAVLAASKLCPAPPTPAVNCSDPTQYATNPVCKPPVPPTPWYLQWYVIAGVLGAVGLGLVSAKKSRPTNP